ncbi:MAG: acyl-CoA thioesterase, partial [Thermoplasmata archaeon]
SGPRPGTVSPIYPTRIEAGAMAAAPAPPSSGPGTWPTSRRFTVAYHDVDALNHLNHAAYFRYMETLRCDYYLPRRGLTDPRELDIIVAEATCRYLAPARYSTEMIGEVAPARPLGATSFQLLYRFSAPSRPATVYARGRTVVVCYDYAVKAKKPIDPSVRSRMDRDAVDPVPEGWGGSGRP